MREGIMLCYPFDIRRLEKWGGKAFIQYKLNGERCRAICLGQNIRLLSSEGNLIQFLPHINAALAQLDLRGVELDGELYCHGMSLQDIHGIVSRKINPHPEYARIEYHIFDIVEILPQVDRFAMLNTIEGSIIRKGLFEDLKIVNFEIVESLVDINEFLEIAMGEGYEGFVLRSYSNIYTRKRSTNMMKFKPTQEDVYPIIGWEEEISIHGEPKGSLGALTCQGDDGTPFSVGTGYSREDRVKLWKDRESLKGKHLKVKYQYLTPSGKKPMHSVAIQILNLTQ